MNSKDKAKGDKTVNIYTLQVQTDAGNFGFHFSEKNFAEQVKKSLINYFGDKIKCSVVSSPVLDFSISHIAEIKKYLDIRLSLPQEIKP